VVGLYDPVTGRYTAHVSAQSIHATRDHAARALGVEPTQVRFVAPDVGGGFGAKNFIYPEYVLVPWAAKRIGRPVKWIAGRNEVFLADHLRFAEVDFGENRSGRLEVNQRYAAFRL
jgi:carbon-monoxide dehydrogenase large subunit